jgi:hypothetical protein
MAMTLPRGSVFSIEAKDLLATPAGTTKVWNKVTEHNRSEFSINVERIEKVVRTSNGTLRKNFVTDKRKFSTEEYKNILNPIIEQAVKDNVLMLKKVPKDGKNVFLYYNPSNKRIGYFFDGKLYSVPELSLLTGINENTLYYRLAKYNIYKAITGV